MNNVLIDAQDNGTIMSPSNDGVIASDNKETYEGMDERVNKSTSKGTNDVKYITTTKKTNEDDHRDINVQLEEERRRRIDAENKLSAIQREHAKLGDEQRRALQGLSLMNNNYINQITEYQSQSMEYNTIIDDLKEKNNVLETGLNHWKQAYEEAVSTLCLYMTMNNVLLIHIIYIYVCMYVCMNVSIFIYDG